MLICLRMITSKKKTSATTRVVPREKDFAMDLIRRVFATEAGEELLLSRGAFAMAVKYNEMRDATGLPDDAILSDPITSVPMPLYSPEFTGEGNRWPGVSPQMMFHPLFWLPSSLSERYLLTQPEDENPILESDAMWMVRVALTMAASGLYDAETGGWVDILATVGINIENKADRERVKEWQAGGVDDLLDSIDLTGYLATEGEAEGWALNLSILMLEDLRMGSWALMATDLLENCDMAAEHRNGDREKMAFQIKTAASMATALLSDVPDVDGTRLFDFWVAQEELIDSGTLKISEVFDGPLRSIEEKLEYIVETYSDSLRLLAELHESVGASDE